MVNGVKSSPGISHTLIRVSCGVINHVRDSPDDVPLEKTRKCRVRDVHGNQSHDRPLRCQSEGSSSHFPFGIKIYVAKAESLLW